MPLLIDTYNVLHVVGVLPPDLAGIEIDDLVKLIQTSRFSREKTQLICDGGPKADSPPGRFGPISVRYAGPGRKADDLIATIVRRISNPGTVIVVSSDQQVQRAGRKRRCRTLSSEEFLRLLVEDHEAASRQPRAAGRARSAHPLPNDAVNAWLDIFGLSVDEMVQTEADLSLPSPPPVSEDAENDAEPVENIEVADAATQHDDRIDDPPPAGPLIPPDVLEQAERLWNAKQED